MVVLGTPADRGRGYVSPARLGGPFRSTPGKPARRHGWAAWLVKMSRTSYWSAATRFRPARASDSADVWQRPTGDASVAAAADGAGPARRAGVDEHATSRTSGSTAIVRRIHVVSRAMGRFLPRPYPGGAPAMPADARVVVLGE